MLRENKGADQPRSYSDLRLCFRICRLLVFGCMLVVSLLNLLQKSSFLFILQERWRSTIKTIYTRKEVVVLLGVYVLPISKVCCYRVSFPVLFKDLGRPNITLTVYHGHKAF